MAYSSAAFEQQLRDQLVLRGIPLLSSTRLTDVCKHNQVGKLGLKVATLTCLSRQHYLLMHRSRQSSGERLGAKLQQFDKQMALWLTAEVATTKQFAVISDEENGWCIARRARHAHHSAP